MNTEKDQEFAIDKEKNEDPEECVDFGKLHGEWRGDEDAADVP